MSGTARLARRGGRVVLLAVALWPVDPVRAAAFAGFAALIGHCYPVWLRFKGGKGVATMLGVSLRWSISRSMDSRQL